MSESAWDVLVAGAGPAGATAARILARRGLSVALIDRLDRPCRRLEMISPSMRPLLQGLSLLDLLDDPSIARPCFGIERHWGLPAKQVEDFLAHRGSEGHIVCRSRLDAALRLRAEEAGATLFSHRVVGIAAGENAFRVALSNGSDLVARRVMDATGRPALLARRLGARRMCREKLKARLEERSADDGCLAPGWLLVSGDEGRWRYTMQGPGPVRESWSVSTRPQPRGTACEDASSARLDRAAGQGWMAIGDAAAAFDPITSQGLANAFSTACVAAGVILDGKPQSDAAELYSDAVAVTHERSERARREMYMALAPA